MSEYPANIDLASLNGSNGFRLHGWAGDYTGISVSGAGDVNGDGYADVIVGASGAGPTALHSGASYVVFGKASGFSSQLELPILNGTDGFKLSGVAASDFSGRSVASAGDVNGDGFADLIIGAASADPNGEKSGASYVVFGKASGFGSNFDLSSLDGTNGFRISGEAAYDESGFVVASAGDVNGDGFADVIVSARYGSPHGYQSGANYVVFGKASGFAANLDLSSLDGSNGFKISGVAAGDNSGHSVAAAGDVNGDGFADIIVGAYYASPDLAKSGASYVVFGKAAGFGANFDLASLDGFNGFRLSGVAANDYSGWSVASAGDINGDGFADVVVSAPLAVAPGAVSGASYVVFGRASGFAANFDLSSLDGTNGFRVNGAVSESSGNSVASAGDVNGDGFDDLIVGAPAADPHGGSSGASYVVFGRASGFAASINLSSLDGNAGFKISGVGAGDLSGFSVAAAGDVNGDGLADLIVGAPDSAQYGANSGMSYVVFGQLPGQSVTRIGSEIGQAIHGGAGDDVLKGLDGNDHLIGNGGDDLLDGGANNDLVDAGAGDDTLIGGSGVDVLNGGADDDHLSGGSGKDTLDGGAGDDTLEGGSSNDTASYADAAAGVQVSLAIAGAQDTQGAGFDTLVSIETLTGSRFADHLTAGASGSTLNGGAGNDVLTGGGAVDTLNGGAGLDTQTGGAGNDVFVFTRVTDTRAKTPDVVTDFATGDRIDLHQIDANTGAGGDQAFHLGATLGHTGDIVLDYQAGHDRTVVSLYVNGDTKADAVIWLNGDHHTMTASDFVL